MHRFKNILMVNEPSTGAGTALARAVRLARANEAKLTIVNIAREIPRNLVNVQKAFLRMQEQQLQELAQKAATEGVAVRTGVLVGIPFLEVIRSVIENGHDLVIKPAGGRSGISATLFGSTDMHLFRKCPCPVWIMKPSKHKKYARILAAVDPDPSEAANADLNRLILDLATSIAARDNSELHIVHAWHMPHETSLRSGRFNLPKKDIDRMVADTRKTHRVWLDALLGEYELHDLGATFHLLKGEPERVIPALAQKKRVELIVMGTVARTGIPGFFIGNTAEKTLGAVDCSVLAVKPQAFSTPVET